MKSLIYKFFFKLGRLLAAGFTTDLRNNLRADIRELLQEELQTIRNNEKKNHQILEKIYHEVQRPIHFSPLLSKNQRCRALFIIHAPEFWSALAPIHKRMVLDPCFEPIILTIPGRLLNKPYINTAKNLFPNPEFKVISYDSDDINLLKIVDALQPHIIFKQTPWEGQYPEYLQTKYLLKYRLCYVPYGIHTTNEKSFYNLELINSAWRVYCANSEQVLSLNQSNLTSDINTRISGYPKFEEILNLLSNTNLNQWPIKTSKTPRTKILWSPHHSAKEWLGFSTFQDNYQQIYNLAKNNPEIHIVLRPHPALFENMVAGNHIAQNEIDTFINDFKNLPNCYLDEGAEYVHLFKHSDILVTDGIGFLFEYLLTGKPIIHTDSKRHVGFLDYYKQIEPAFYKAYNFEELESIIFEKLLNGLDERKQSRIELAKLLHPIKGIYSPSQFIVDDIKNSIFH